MDDRLLLVRDLLDRQLADRDRTLYGKVDDVLLRRSGADLEVAALVSGAGAWPGRLPSPLRGPAARVLGTRAAVVPWSRVRRHEAVVHLSLAAAELAGLQADMARRAPGDVLLSRLLGSAAGGRGRVREVEARAAGEGGPRVTALLTGTGGLLVRLGLPRMGRVAQTSR